MTWVDEYRFGEEFDDLRTNPVRADRLTRELASELSSGHPLFGLFPVPPFAPQSGVIM